ncbi:MAG: helix-turn-helix domain-containing protein [Candidatus Kapaibacterium sp.]|nr:MAG: helix-turn-helix domain-containing protein [Candidatus Kapabacteria bacterium]
MINTVEIFDDIHESLAVQQYGDELVNIAKTKSALKLLDIGLSPQQISDALDVPLQTVLNIQRGKH